MTWFKVDDHLASHPLVGYVGDAALGYWMRLGCWLAQFPSEGDFIPEPVAKHLLYGTRRAKLNVLVRAGMLIPEGDGYRMHRGLDVCGSGLLNPAWQIELPPSYRAKIPDALRQAVYERDGFACLHCGSGDDLSLDHVHPWSKGGEDTFENLQTLCRPCNSSKGARV
jgi:hypothetical protein